MVIPSAKTQIDTKIEKIMFKRYLVESSIVSKLVWLLIPAVMVAGLSSGTLAQELPEVIELKSESSEDAQDVYADGASYQNGGKFEIAIEEWVKFRDTYSDDPLAPKSIYYLGCLLYTSDAADE